MVPQSHRLRKVRSEGSSGSRLVLASTTTLQHAACRLAQRTCASHASTHRTQDTDRGMTCSDRAGPVSGVLVRRVCVRAACCCQPVRPGTAGRQCSRDGRRHGGNADADAAQPCCFLLKAAVARAQAAPAGAIDTCAQQRQQTVGAVLSTSSRARQVGLCTHHELVARACRRK